MRVRAHYTQVFIYIFTVCFVHQISSVFYVHFVVDSQCNKSLPPIRVPPLCNSLGSRGFLTKFKRTRLISRRRALDNRTRSLLETYLSSIHRCLRIVPLIHILITSYSVLIIYGRDRIGFWTCRLRHTAACVVFTV